MTQVIIVRIADGYQPEHGTPFDAVVSALNHFEIESVVSKSEGDELVLAAQRLAVERAEFRRERDALSGALRGLREQVEQMRDLFRDDDGTIADACEDANAALATVEGR